MILNFPSNGVRRLRYNTYVSPIFAALVEVELFLPVNEIEKKQYQPQWLTEGLEIFEYCHPNSVSMCGILFTFKQTNCLPPNPTKQTHTVIYNNKQKSRKRLRGL